MFEACLLRRKFINVNLLIIFGVVGLALRVCILFSLCLVDFSVLLDLAIFQDIRSLYKQISRVCSLSPASLRDVTLNNNTLTR